MDDHNNPELESFRQQWRAEVSARTKGHALPRGGDTPGDAEALMNAPPLVPATHNFSYGSTVPTEVALTEHGENLSDSAPYTEAASQRRPSKATTDTEGDMDGASQPYQKEINSALEHYERAVEKEDQGKLGDSVKLYRQAYRVRLLSDSHIVILTGCCYSWMRPLIGLIETSTSPLRRNLQT